LEYPTPCLKNTPPSLEEAFIEVLGAFGVPFLVL
jgi:hypothetical protein